MKIADLPDNIRLELHNHMKRIIRKYYKGLKNGSLKYESFIDKMFSMKAKPQWLKDYPHLEKDKDFRGSLIQYIKNITNAYIQMENQNKLNHNHKHRVLSSRPNTKADQKETLSIQDRQELKKILHDNGYTLSIPSKFLTSAEASYLKEYIQQGTSVPLGWEKILNYIKKST